MMIPEAATFFQTNENLGPSIFFAMLDMAENIRRGPDEPRWRAYIAIVLCAIVARIHPEYHTDQRALYMSCFVWKFDGARVSINELGTVDISCAPFRD